MKVLYFDCEMGAAGDMLMAALYQLLDEKRQKEFLETMNGLGLDGVTVEAQPSKKCGIGGIHMAVSVRGMEEEEATNNEENKGNENDKNENINSSAIHNEADIPNNNQ